MKPDFYYPVLADAREDRAMFDPNRLLPRETQRMHQREMHGAARQRWTGDHPRSPEHARLPRLQRRDGTTGS